MKSVLHKVGQASSSHDLQSAPNQRTNSHLRSDSGDLVQEDSSGRDRRGVSIFTKLIGFGDSLKYATSHANIE